MFKRTKEQHAARRLAKQRLNHIMSQRVVEPVSDEEAKERARANREAYVLAHVIKNPVFAQYSGEPVGYVKEEKKLGKMLTRWKEKREANEEARRLENGYSMNLSAKEMLGADEDIPSSDVTWTVDKSTICSISPITSTTQAQCTVTALAVGNARVTATQISTGDSGSVPFKVTAPVISIDSATMDLDPNTAQAGSAYVGEASVTCSPADNGSYTYTWSKPTGAGENWVIIPNGSICSITGDFAADGVATVTCIVTDGNGKSVNCSSTITVSGGGSAAVLTPANCTNDAPITVDVTAGAAVSIPINLDLDLPDDGTYTYDWYCNGNNTAVGSIKTSDGSDSAFSGATRTGAKYSSVIIYGTAKTPVVSGPILWSCIVTDSAGNTYKTPSNAIPSGGSSDVTNHITLS